MNQPSTDEVEAALTYSPQRGLGWVILSPTCLVLEGFFISQSLRGLVERPLDVWQWVWLAVWLAVGALGVISTVRLERATHRLYQAQLGLLSQLGLQAIKAAKGDRS